MGSFGDKVLKIGSFGDKAIKITSPPKVMDTLNFLKFWQIWGLWVKLFKNLGLRGKKWVFGWLLFFFFFKGLFGWHICKKYGAFQCVKRLALGAYHYIWMPPPQCLDVESVFSVYKHGAWKFFYRHHGLKWSTDGRLLTMLTCFPLVKKTMGKYIWTLYSVWKVTLRQPLPH